MISAGMSPFYKSLADVNEDYWEKVLVSATLDELDIG